MGGKSKVSDDYVGALLRVQGAPNDVVISLLKCNSCNVDGLRTHTAMSQVKCAKRLDINVDLLDGLPPKVREYGCHRLTEIWLSSYDFLKGIVLLIRYTSTE